MSTSRMLVSTDLLLSALGLPQKTRILAVNIGFPFITVEFLVDHPDIPEDANTVMPEFLSHYADCGHIERIEFVGWNPRK